MPKYAIERQYLVPVYQHLFVDAPDLDAACRQALDHDDWDSSETDYDASRETTIACAVEIPVGKTELKGGAEATATEMIYQAGLPHLHIPRQFRDDDDVSRASPRCGRCGSNLPGSTDAAMTARRTCSPTASERSLQALDDSEHPGVLRAPRDPVMRRFDDRELAAVRVRTSASEPLLRSNWSGAEWLIKFDPAI